MEKVNARLLLTARHLRELTQKDASQLIGISQGKLSKAEHGIQDFPLEYIQELSNAYNLPSDFFFQGGGNVNLDKSYFRRRVTLSEKNIDSFKAKITIQLSIIDKLFEPIDLPTFNLQTQKPDDDYTPITIAQNIRSQFKVMFGPIPNLVRLVENHGILVQRMDFGNEKIDAFSAVSENGRIVIFLNSTMPSDRTRFSLAHELGHIIMHQFFYVNDKELAEIQADMFASELLMPANDICYDLNRLSLADLPLLKRKWKVSMHAIVRRARDLGLITSQRYRNIHIEFSKSGYAKKEPWPIPYEKPTLIDETLKLYQNELGYSSSELSRIACISKEEFVRWFGNEIPISRVYFNVESFKNKKKL